MKKLFFLVLCMVLFYACKTDQTQVRLKGNISGMNDGEIYFIKAGDEETIDTVKVRQGKFSYSKELTEPTVYMINFGSEEQPAFSILEPGDMTLNYSPGVQNSLAIKGGKEQEVYNQFLTSCEPVFKQMDSIASLASAHEEDTLLLTALQKEFLAANETLKDKQREFIKKHPSGVASAFIAVNYLNERQDETLPEVEAIFNGLQPIVQQSYYGKKINDMVQVAKRVSPGQVAPEFSLNNVAGNPVPLSSFKGKVTLIDFWASWCGPCRVENPNVVRAYKEFHPKGFEILGVSLDNQKIPWQTAIKKDALIWTQVSDLKGWNSDVAALYGIESIPSNILIDKDGRILGRNLIGESLTKKLNELYK